MTRIVIGLVLAATGCAPLPRPSAAAPGDPAAAPSPIVIIHGAWGGGWAWRGVDSLLTAAGHTVSRPTLTGLGERVHLATPGTDLSTHVEDVVNHLVFERLDDVVLVGHSYGGMVAIAVAHRVPERVRRIVLIDAFLPEEGQSVADAVRGTRIEGWIQGLIAGAEDGRISPSWLGPDGRVADRRPAPARDVHGAGRPGEPGRRRDSWHVRSDGGARQGSAR